MWDNNNDFGAVLQQPSNSGAQKTPLRAPLWEAGTMVGRYRVQRRIGAGGAGEVYEAWDETLERPVALKVLRPVGSLMDSVRERFLFEARVTASFRHPNIVTVYDSGELAGRPWVALELLTGMTLRERLRLGPIAPLAMVDIARDIAAALEYAHRARIVHRDLKPDNVFLGDDGTVRVLDFGIAKPVSRDRAQPCEDTIIAVRGEVQTAAGQLVGTPAYMAPEQWLGLPATPATDVFQLGLLLFRAISGERAQSARGPEELARAALNHEPLPELPDGRDVSPALVALVAACVEKRAQARPTIDVVRRSLDLISASESKDADWDRTLAHGTSLSALMRDEPTLVLSRGDVSRSTEGAVLRQAV